MPPPENLNLELLIKLMALTTSPNDGEALSASRKANALLLRMKWDWDRLLRGRVTVAADPFSGLAPVDTTPRARTAPTAPPKHKASPPPPPPPPQQTWRPVHFAQARYKPAPAQSKKAAAAAKLNDIFGR